MICDECKQDLFFNYDFLCPVCQQKSLEGYTHPFCLQTRRNLPDLLITPYKYTGLVREVFLNSKYHKKEFVLVDSLVKYLEPYHEQFNLHNFSGYIATFVPPDPKRLKERGFSLPQIICEGISKSLKIEYKSLLVKTQFSNALSKLSRNQRKLAVKNVYRVKSTKVPSRVLLIDDIFTTGATILENTRVLKKAGVKSVACFALAYRPLNYKDLEHY